MLVMLSLRSGDGTFLRRLCFVRTVGSPQILTIPPPPHPPMTAHLLFERTTGSLGARARSFAPERQRHKRLFGWVLILFGKLQTPLRSNRSYRSRHGNTATPQKRSPPPGDPIGSNCGSIAGERARARARTHTPGERQARILMK